LKKEQMCKPLLLEKPCPSELQIFLANYNPAFTHVLHVLNFTCIFKYSSK